MAGIGIDLIGLNSDSELQSVSTITGLRLMMTVIPIIGLAAAYFVFKKKFRLTDQKIDEMNLQLKERNGDDNAV
jgi:melibiose permease